MINRYRTLCAELLQLLDDQGLSAMQAWYGVEGEPPAVTRARAALAQPDPEGPTDEEWEALKERVWDHYRTVGYQGELFIYDRDFDTALDDVRRELAHWGRELIDLAPVGASRRTVRVNISAVVPGAMAGHSQATGATTL